MSERRPRKPSGSDPPRRRRGSIEAIGGGLAHGLIIVLAFPGVGLWPLAILAPLPLIYISHRVGLDGRSAARAGLLAGLGTIPMWLFEHQWVAQMSLLGLFPMVLVLAAYPAMYVWALARIRRRWPRAGLWIAAGPLWMAIEFLRGSLAFDGYPWVLIAHPLIAWSALAMPARWFGVYFVGMLCAVVSAAVLEIAVGCRRRGVVVLGTVAAVWAGLAIIPAGGSENPDQTLTVGLIQTNIPQSVRGSWSQSDRVRTMISLDRMTREAAAQIGDRSPSLIVWPETMFPGYFLDRESLDQVELLDGPAAGFRDSALAFAGATERLAQSIAPPLLVGVSAYSGLRFDVDDEGIRWDQDRRFNSAILLDGDVRGGRYDKLFLTPFGEVMPYISAWPWLEKKLLSFGAAGMRFDLDTGDSEFRFDLGQGVEVATPICFEATMARVCRRLVFEDGQRRAGVMVNMSNDGWFGTSDAGRRLHLLAARWRCVELGTPMVRSANTGITCLIDASGKVVSRMPVREEGFLVVRTPMGRGVTVFARLGPVIPWVGLVFSIILIASTYFGTPGAGNADAVQGTRDGLGDRS